MWNQIQPASALHQGRIAFVILCNPLIWHHVGKKFFTLCTYYSDDALDKEEKVKGRMQRSSGLLMRTLCLCHQPRFLDTGRRGRADCLNSTDLLVIKISVSVLHVRHSSRERGAVAPRQGVVSAIFYSVSITAMHAFAGIL